MLDIYQHVISTFDLVNASYLVVTKTLEVSKLCDVDIYRNSDRS